MSASLPIHAPTSTQDPLDVLEQRIVDRTAMVAVVGLGHVGLSLLLRAASAGFEVVGVDSDRSKVEALRGRRSYLGDVADEDLAVLDPRRSHVTCNPGVLVAADVILLAVPTPLSDRGLDLTLVTSAARSVAVSLRPGQLVVLESTIGSGTVEEVLAPIFAEAGLPADTFAVGCSLEPAEPASLRATDATAKVVSGVGQRAAALTGALYRQLVGAVAVAPDPRVAELDELDLLADCA